MFCRVILSVTVIGLQWLQVWSGCPNGWQDGVGMCYIQMKNTSDFVPWGYANSQCKMMDVRGRLPVFKDAMSWNVFTMGVKQIKAQLMAQGTPPPGPKPATIVPFGAYRLNDEWYWLDGSKMSDGANNWQSGEPNGTNVPENCVGFNPINGDIGYGDMECSLHFGFVCQMDPGETAGKMNNAGSVDATMSTPGTTCAAGWDSVGGACYKQPAAAVTISTPDDGTAACTKLDPKAKLPEFYNYGDYDMFIRYLGSKVEAEHRNIALGFRKKGANFANSDGKAYYLNWYQDEPTDGKSCTFMNDLHGYMWSAMDCTEKGVIFCQLDSRTVASVAKGASAAAQTGGGGGGGGGGGSSGGSSGSSGGSSAGSSGGGGDAPKSGSSWKTLNALLFLGSIAVAVVNVCRKFNNF